MYDGKLLGSGKSNRARELLKHGVLWCKQSLGMNGVANERRKLQPQCVHCRVVIVSEIVSERLNVRHEECSMFKEMEANKVLQ